MTKFRDGQLGPTVILFTICFVITLALAATYQVTMPVIETVERERSREVLGEVSGLEGSGFEPIPDVELPAGVTEAYMNGSAYVFKSGAKGFNGTVTYMIGINGNGEITGISMFDQNETPGLGTKIAEADYLGQYYGDANPDEVDAVTGATKTSNSLKSSIKQAKAAFEIVKGAR